MTVFSFQLAGNFAFFKKNDANDLYQLSYNLIHKPAVLGIAGAVLGLSGYRNSGELPEYYEKLSALKMAIVPGYHQPLKKMMSVFNNASGLGSEEAGAWQVKEQILSGDPLIRYTVFIMEDGSVEQPLIQRLKDKLRKGETTYPLYFGKNEFFAVHQHYRDGYRVQPLTESPCVVDSIIRKGDKDEIVSVVEADFEHFDQSDYDSAKHMIYEYLPFGLDNDGFYEKDMFVLTRRKLNLNRTRGFYRISDPDKGQAVNVQFI